MSGRIVSAEEAQKRLAVAEWIVDHGVWPSPQAAQILTLNERVRDMAHTVVVQAEQIAAVLTLHTPDGDGCCATCSTRRLNVFEAYPCTTARALGVTE